MPFVQLHLPQHFTAAVKQHISRSVHESLMVHFNVPQDDYFHVIHTLRANWSFGQGKAQMIS